LAAFLQGDANGQQQAAEQQLVAKDVHPALVQGMVEQVRKRHHQAKVDGFVAKGQSTDAIFYQQANGGLKTNKGNYEHKNSSSCSKKEFE